MFDSGMAIERFEERVKNVDVVVDFVGGETLARSWSLLRPNAAIASAADFAVTSTAPAGANGFFVMVQPNAARLEAMAEQVAKGKLSSKISKVFRRDELLQAIEANRAGGRTGRIIVDFKERNASAV
jgi:NADPH:quinone reductase-like Zn-dependent oxidoreductase